RHRRVALRVRQELPGAEFPGVLPSRLPSGRQAAYRIGMGAAPYPRRGVRGRHPCLLRTLFRPTAIRDFPWPGADAPVPDVPPLPDGSAATTGSPAENAAKRRRPGTTTRSQSRPLENRQAAPRALDAGTHRDQGTAEQPPAGVHAMVTNHAGPAASVAQSPGTRGQLPRDLSRTDGTAQGSRAD